MDDKTNEIEHEESQNQISSKRSEEDGTDKLIKFLNTDRGHEIANKIMAGMGKYFHRSASYELLQRIFQVCVVLIVILVVYKLADQQRLDASIGVLLGTLVGYIFAKKE